MLEINHIAVVPIFVNAGTALLPAVMAPVLSAAALLLRPRELLRACRRRPVSAAVLLVVLIGLWPALQWLLAPRPVRAVVRDDRIDWNAVAIDALRREQPGNAAQLLLPAWQHNEPGAMFLSSPAVRSGRVYAATCVIDVTGLKYGAVVCLDAQTGRPIWKTEMADGQDLKPFFSSPVLTADGESVLIGQGLHDDADSDLLCLDSRTGQVRWRLRTPLHIESTPAIVGDVVIAGVGAIEGPDHKQLKGTDPGYVLAARIADGKESWRVAVNDPESSPAVGSDGTVYIGSGYNGNAVVAIESGACGDERIRWKTAAPFPITAAVTLAGDRVIVGGGNGDYVSAADDPAGVVMALDAASGGVVWQQNMPDAVLGACAVDNGQVICPVRSGELVALAMEDGGVIWRSAVGSAPLLAGPAIVDGRVYAVSAEGQLHVIDAADGRVVERHALNDPANPGTMNLSLSSPTISGDRLYVGSETGGLRCYSLNRGER